MPAVTRRLEELFWRRLERAAFRLSSLERRVARIEARLTALEQVRR
jgi:hypothetical protein